MGGWIFCARRDWVCEQIGVQVRKGKQDCRRGEDNPVFRLRKGKVSKVQMNLYHHSAPAVCAKAKYFIQI